MLKEFKEFIARGNVMDLAVAVIMGGAFGAIVKSLVDDIIMPLVGIILGGIDFKGLAITVGSANIKYGQFIQALVNFLIIAFVIFIMVKALEKAKNLRKSSEDTVEEETVSAEEELLTEIRDLLKIQNKRNI